MRVLAVWLVLWPALAMADPVSDWIGQQPEEHRGFLTRVQTIDAFTAYREQCPADVFSLSGQRVKGTADCDARPGWCLTQCRFGRGDACFGAAYFIDTTMDDGGDADLSFPLYMAACADGNANGCVNAGATAKNGRWNMSRPQLASGRDCQFRTYQMACAVGAPWGCFMLGMEWRFEGVNGAFDPEQARAAWERACALAPDGGACRASSARMEAQ